MKRPSPFRRISGTVEGGESASVLFLYDSVFLRASPSSFLRKEPYVTKFTFVSPVLHNEEG